MLVAALIVTHRGVLYSILNSCQRQPAFTLGIGRCGQRRHLQRIQGNTRVTLGHSQEMVQGILIQRHIQAAQPPRLILHGSQNNGAHLTFGQRIETENPGAGEKRGSNLKGRILGGSPDEGNCAVLNKGQNGILLGLIEAMNLINEKDGLLLVLAAAFLGFLDDAAQVSHPRRDCTDGAEVGIGGIGNNIGQGGLAAARRPPEDNRGQLASFNGPPEHAPLAHELLLADELLKIRWPHPGCQRRLLTP